MDGQHTHAEPLRFRDPRQQRIHDLLLLIGPGPAAFYRDACRIMQASAPFETTTHLVGHLLREIESALRDVVSSAADDTESASRNAKQGTHRREISAILKGLGIGETEPVAQAWLCLAMPENEEALHRRAHRDALSAPRPADEPFHAFWNEMEGILFVVLARFEARFLKAFALLDTLIGHPSPGKAEVDRLRNHVPNTLVTMQYFFDKLMNPAWIQPLWEHHFFNNPVEPIYDQEQGTISIPPWPASRYLVRMATHAEVQELVLTIALQIRETENVRVYEDLTDIALTLPANLGAQLVPQVKRGLDSPYHSVLPHKLGRIFRKKVFKLLLLNQSLRRNFVGLCLPTSQLAENIGRYEEGVFSHFIAK